MGSILYSNCSTITTGCFIYNDIFKTSPVGNGYYSDGTNCYDVQFGNGYVQSVSTCTVEVYFTVGGETNFDGNGDWPYVIYASTTADSYASNPINVNTNVTVFFDLVAEFATYNSSSGVLGSGLSCNTVLFIDGTYANQAVYSVTPTSVSPTSNGNQNYNDSTGDLGPYTC
jgi:hypothetical protein